MLLHRQMVLPLPRHLRRSSDAEIFLLALIHLSARKVDWGKPDFLKTNYEVVYDFFQNGDHRK